MPILRRHALTGRIGLAGALAAAAGCGTDLAATEAPAPRTPTAAPAVAPPSAEPPAAPVAPSEFAGWDFFGPPAPEAAGQETAVQADDLHLRGFVRRGDDWEAILWLGENGGAGELLMLAAGGSARGVSLVELDEAAGVATVEHPGRAVLRLAPSSAGPTVRPPRPVASRVRPAVRPRPTAGSPAPNFGRPRSPGDFRPPEPPAPPSVPVIPPRGNTADDDD